MAKITVWAPGEVNGFGENSTWTRRVLDGFWFDSKKVVVDKHGREVVANSLLITKFSVNYKEYAVNGEYANDAPVSSSREIINIEIIPSVDERAVCYEARMK